MIKRIVYEKKPLVKVLIPNIILRCAIVMFGTALFGDVMQGKLIQGKE